MSSILFINRVYPPDHGATGQLLQELAEALAARQWAVTVLCAHSRADGTERGMQMVNGIRVVRAAALPFTRRSHWRRGLSYLSLYPALAIQGLRLQPPDVTVTLTDPPLQLLLGPVIRRFRGTRLVHWAQDVYPEAAEALGVLRRNGPVARLLRTLSTFALRRHDAVIAVGRCMRRRLVERGCDPERVVVIPNWSGISGSAAGDDGLCGATDKDGLKPGQRFRREQGWENRRVIMYSGNIGLAHPLESMVRAAACLERLAPEALFVFVGGGARLSWLRQATNGLGNVRFLAAQPKELLGESLAAADIHLAAMHDELCGLVVPSKVYGALAARRPCLFIGPRESEAARTILRLEAGAVFSPSDSGGLIDWLDKWIRDASGICKPARMEFASASVGLESAIEAFLQVLNQPKTEL